jgi:hypothetical protein
MYRHLTVFELDVPRCIHNYGDAPCQAEVGVTGEQKCTNAPGTCQDPVNFESETQILRWVTNAGYGPDNYYAIPSLNSINTDSQHIQPGEHLGKRERCTLTFGNHAYNDWDLDPYVLERDYNPWERGTFWGKFDARYPNIQGYTCRLRRGFADQPLSEYETSHYVAEKGTLSGAVERYQIVARDGLTFVEGNKSLCPVPSNGVLSADIDESMDPFTLEPAGIGAQYPETEFRMQIGDEVIRGTRSGDVITPTIRGDLFTVAEEHDAGETVQVGAEFQAPGNVGLDAADILDKLLSFTDTPAIYYDYDAWKTQVQINQSPLYTGFVFEPTPVHKLIGELMRDLALNIWTDIIAQKIRMEFIRQKPIVAELDDDIIDNLDGKTLTDKRVSVFVIRFGRRNPLEKMDEGKNYGSTLARPTNNPKAMIYGNTPAIRTHFSRFIPSALRNQADETARNYLARYEIAPRQLAATVPTAIPIKLSDIVQITTRAFSDEWGGKKTFPAQVVKLDRSPGSNSAIFEEYLANFAPSDTGILEVTLNTDVVDMLGYATMRDYFNSLFGNITINPGTVVRFAADPGVVWGSSSTSNFSIVMGYWPEISDGVTIEIVRLFGVGRGGNHGPSPQGQGRPGGPCLYTRVPVELIDCTIGGGGGGGGSYTSSVGPGASQFFPGGGGAGRNPGLGFDAGSAVSENGTLEQGGSGSRQFGDGGDLGQPGEAADNGTPGGAAGVAIDGISYVTLTNTTVHGPTIN